MKADRAPPAGPVPTINKSVSTSGGDEEPDTPMMEGETVCPFRPFAS